MDQGDEEWVKVGVWTMFRSSKSWGGGFLRSVGGPWVEILNFLFKIISANSLFFVDWLDEWMVYEGVVLSCSR